MFSNLPIRVKMFTVFALIALACMAILVGSLWLGETRSDPSLPLSDSITAGLVAGFLILGLVVMVWRLFDEQVAKPVERVAADIRARTHADAGAGPQPSGAPFLGDLAPAAAAMSDSLSDARKALDETVADHTAKFKRETDRLASLLSDVPVGLLVCASNHSLVFYNAPIVDILRDTGRPRLNRPVFELLRGGPIRQSYRRLLASEGARDHAEVLVSTTGCGRSLMAHMRLVSGALGLGATPGYVLTLRDVTADLAVHTERERLMAEIISAVRHPASTLKRLFETDQHVAMLEGGEEDAQIAHRARDLANIVHEICVLYDASQTTWWPMQDIRAADLIDGIRGNLGENGPTIDAPHPNMMLHCDGYAMVALLSEIVGEIVSVSGTESVSIAITPEQAGAQIAFNWEGETLTKTQLDDLLAQPVADSAQSITGREILDRHGTDLVLDRNLEGHSGLSLLISEAHAAVPTPPARGEIAERPPVYDFELLQRPLDATKSGRRLKELIYIVFDTETTGLNPHQGDEIVQIAAIRMINGRLVEGEVLDVLVDPERPIPPTATAVHGISDDMVRGAPTIGDAGAQFHDFSHEAVLVAHNAPFDMAFFHRHAKTIGAEFDHPVFDTVLLSAVLFGQSADHTLDSLAARFGVDIPEKDRHTAYGDALATAQVFQRMLPMLEAKGLATYDTVLAEMQRNSQLLREMKSRAANG